MLLILIFSLTQLTCIGTSHSDTVKLKGGLIYKHEGQAQINQDFLIFKRSVDSSALKSVAQRLFDSTTLYEEYCNYLEEINNKGPQMIQSEDYQQAMDKNITVKYIATPLKYPLKDSTHIMPPEHLLPFITLISLKLELYGMLQQNDSSTSQTHIQPEHPIYFRTLYMEDTTLAVHIWEIGNMILTYLQMQTNSHLYTLSQLVILYCVWQTQSTLTGSIMLTHAKET